MYIGDMLLHEWLYSGFFPNRVLQTHTQDCKAPLDNQRPSFSLLHMRPHDWCKYFYVVVLHFLFKKRHMEMHPGRDNKAHLSGTTCVQMEIHLLGFLQSQQSSWKGSLVPFHLHHCSYTGLGFPHRLLWAKDWAWLPISIQCRRSPTGIFGSWKSEYLDLFSEHVIAQLSFP